MIPRMPPPEVMHLLARARSSRILHEVFRKEESVSQFDQLTDAISPHAASVSATPKGYRVAWSSATWPEGVSVTDADRQQAYQRAYAAEVTGRL